MRKCAIHSVDSILPFRTMSRCRIPPTRLMVVLMLVFIIISSIFVVFGTKATIEVNVKRIQDLQHKVHLLLVNSGNATFRRGSDSVNLSHHGEETAVKPDALAGEIYQSRNRYLLHNETKHHHDPDDEGGKAENQENNVDRNYGVHGNAKNSNEKEEYYKDDDDDYGEDALDRPKSNDAPEYLHKHQAARDANISSVSNVTGQRGGEKPTDLNPRLLTTLPPKQTLETPSGTFIPDQPDTSPLRQPPDIPKRFLIEEANYCRQRPNLQIIAYVHSSISRVNQRMETRRTWANASAYDMGAMNVTLGVVFMVGRAKNEQERKIVREESNRYHDIVQGDFGDHYRLLSYKGLAGLYWINKHCSHATWTLHSDDDTHIDIFLYHKALQQLDAESKQKFVCSFMYGPALRYGRYKVRYEEYPGKDYPLYCSGGVWFLQTKLIPRLLEARKTVPFLWVDDAYVTGLLARRAGIGHLPFHKYYGGPHVDPKIIGKEVAWFVKFAPRLEWWQKIVDYHKKYSMQQPATLPH